jgi:hypothetical protein
VENRVHDVGVGLGIVIIVVIGASPHQVGLGRYVPTLRKEVAD